jgi:hypothetical protein
VHESRIMKLCPDRSQPPELGTRSSNVVALDAGNISWSSSCIGCEHEVPAQPEELERDPEH